jgi:hypothetical protein
VFPVASFEIVRPRRGGPLCGSGSSCAASPSIVRVAHISTCGELSSLAVDRGAREHIVAACPRLVPKCWALDVSRFPLNSCAVTACVLTLNVTSPLGASSFSLLVTSAASLVNLPAGLSSQCTVNPWQVTLAAIHQGVCARSPAIRCRLPHLRPAARGPGRMLHLSVRAPALVVTQQSRPQARLFFSSSSTLLLASLLPHKLTGARATQRT